MKGIAFLATLATVAIAAVVYLGADEEVRPGADPAASADVSQLSQLADPVDRAAAGAESGDAAAGNTPHSPTLSVPESEQDSPLTRVRQMLEHSRDQRGNMQAFFEALRKLCAAEGLDHAQCSALLDDALTDHADPAYAAMLQRIMERLPDYEGAMQRTVMSMETPPPQRYAVLDAQRRQLLGEAETELMFGQERALAKYRFAYGDLMEGEAASLGPDQRLQRLEQLQQQYFDDHEQALQEARGPHAAYQQERQLLLLGIDDPRQQEAITRQLREKHFDDETVAKMEARDAEVARQQKVLEAYQADVAALEAELAPLRETLTADQWQARYQEAMKQLRLKHFSDDGAGP